MIERLPEGNGTAFGFRVVGKVTAEEVEAFAPQLEGAIGRLGHRKIGILADVSAMESADWSARLAEIGFIRKWSDRIERVAIVGSHRWEEIVAQILASTVLVQADTQYFEASEILHAWHWVKTGARADTVPVRRIHPRDELLGDYVPEYRQDV